MAIVLNASTDKVNYGDVSFVDSATALTIFCVFKPTAAVASGDRIINKWDPTIADKCFIFNITNTDEIQFKVQDGAGGLADSRITDALNVANGTTYRVAATWDAAGGAAGLKIYVNGFEEASTISDNGGPSSLAPSSSMGLTVGNQDDGTGAAIDCEIAELAIWTSKLSDAKLAALTGASTKANPEEYLADDLQLYDPLFSTDSRDRVGQIAPTHTGTSNAAAHFGISPLPNYKMILPYGQMLMTGAATYTAQAAAAGGVIDDRYFKVLLAGGSL